MEQEEILLDFYRKIKIQYTEPFDLEILLTVSDDLRKRRAELLRTISPYTFQLLQNKPEIIEFKNRENTAQELFSVIKEIIREECANAIKDRMQLIINTYDFFFMELNKLRTRLISPWASQNSGDGIIAYPSDLRIFTTNYDTCVEAYLNKRRINFTKGVTERHGNYIFDTNSYDDGGARVGLFKLHGSIDIFRTENGDIIHHPAVGREESTTLGEKIEEDVIMYPVEASGYALSSQSPFIDLFRLFRDRISRDNIWVVIGFSFRDKTITSVFNDVLRTRVDREMVRVIFIDPRSEEIKGKLKNSGFQYLGEKIKTSKLELGDKNLFEDFDRLLRF